MIFILYKDLDVNDLYDESNSDRSDLGYDSVAMEETREEHVPIEEHMKSNEPVCQSTKTSCRVNSKRMVGNLRYEK